MYEYAWAPGGPGPGYSSGYYVGILQYNSPPTGAGYFLTTQYNNNYQCSSTSCEYYDYYYSGSGWSGGHLNYYFLEDNTGDIRGYSGPYCSKNNQFCDIFAPPDQQKNKTYYQYGVFWLYNWFQIENNNENNNMNIFFLMNGNIFNYSLASEPYMLGEKCWWSWFSLNWKCSPYYAYAIPPNPPGIVFCPPNTGECEPLFAQSYINAYNTAFNQEVSGFTSNYQKALNNYHFFTYDDVNNNFIPGTFGYDEQYNDQNNSNNNIIIDYLQDIASVYSETPYLFVSAGSGGGPGFMYLDWIIVTYGVPYIVSIS